MELQDIYRRYLGEFGLFQLFVITLLFIMRIPNSMITMDVVFFAATPYHWCKYPRYNNIINMTDIEWKQLFIPINEKTKEFDSCKIYSWAKNFSMTSDTINSTLTSAIQSSAPISNGTEYCDQWEYDTWTHVKTSLVSRWDMVCGRAWMKSTISSVFVIGWVIGLEIGCYVADKYGRRNVIIVSGMGTVVFQLILPFITNYTTFVVLQCVMAAFVQSGGAILFTMCTESVGTSVRTAIVAAYMIMWAVSYAALAGIAYLLREAFSMQLFIGIISILILLPSFFLPESLEWYVAKGKNKEANERLKLISRWNKKTLPDNLQISVQKATEKTKTKVLDLVRHKHILRITIIMAFNWFLNGVVYFAIAWNAADLHGSLYLNVFLSGMVEIPAYLLNIPLLQKVGRRWGMLLSTLMAGVVYLAAIPLPKLGSIILIMFAKLFISMSFTIAYQYTVELYPTVIRSTALAVAILFARIGTFIAPYLPLLGPVIPDIICGTLCLVGAVSLLFLPETMNMPLRSSVQDAEHHSALKLKEIFRFPLCEKKEHRKRNKEPDTKVENISLANNNMEADVL